MKIWSAAVLALTLASPAAAQVPTPASQFGFEIGSDRRLASAEDIDRYFTLVASRSDRVRVIDVGPTTDGHRTVAAIISAPENIRNLEDIRRANQRLADPRTLPADQARSLAETSKVVLAIGAGIHASEVGPTQAACEILFWLASTSNAETERLLRDLVVVLIPSLNPDGYRLVVDWYERQKGTRFEGGAMPWLYHRYAGHDINRDAFMMNLAESRNLARLFYTEWHPQVFLTMHQMGVNGPRFFVPPNDDPVDPNYDPMIWREAALLGSAMALQLQRDRRSGVLSNGMYDYYWPGYEDSAPLGHNVVCLLTEAASAQIATPVTLTASDLKGGVKGLPEYKRQMNFPDPWPGGRWALKDIIDYQLSAVRGLLNATAAYRHELLENFYEMGRRAVEAGQRGGPFAFVIPRDQHDPHAARKLEELLLQAGVEIHRANEPFRADGEAYPAGTDVILLAQPYRAYVKTLLEVQRYPASRPSVDAPSERPYDVAGWTLPYQMGVDVRTIERKFEPPAVSRLEAASISPAKVWGESKPGYYLIEGRGNGAAIAANQLVAAGSMLSWTTAAMEANGFRYAPGALVVPHSKASEAIVREIARDLGLRVDGMKGKPPADSTPIGRARVALYKPWMDSSDEGWTRWVLEQYGFKFATVVDADIRAGNLLARFDAIVIPAGTADQLIRGNHPDTMPPEYTGGLGERGVEALRAFVDSGGTLICLGAAGSLATSALGVPLRDAAADADTRFVCPGSILRLELDEAQPLAFGMTPTSSAFFAFGSAYEPASPALLGNRLNTPSVASSLVTVARYATQDLLLSGWLEGGDIIAGRSAVVQVPQGSGRVILIGFSVWHRGQSHATFRLLFNAIFTSDPTQTVPRRR